MATVILKATHRCNARCSYCDVVRFHSGVMDMTLSTLDTLFQRLDDFLSRHPEEKMLLTWHGGEPLLLGADYFHAAADLQAGRCSATQSRIEHCIQSNITLLTEDFVPALRRLGIRSVGSSYDPAPGVRGLGEAVDTAAYNRAFLSATGVLERHGMGWGIIYVVTSQSLPDPLSVFYALANLTQNGAFNLNPVIVSDAGRRHLAISAIDYADFLGSVFPTWYAHRDRYPLVEPFASLLKNFTGEGMRLGCEDSGTCARRHINIDPAGNVSQCGRSCDLGIMQWGSIHASSLDEILQHATLDELERRSRLLREGDCRDCDIFPVCHGGCPIDAYVHHGTYAARTSWCAGKRRFLKRYFEPITGLRVADLHAHA